MFHFWKKHCHKDTLSFRSKVRLLPLDSEYISWREVGRDLKQNDLVFSFSECLPLVDQLSERTSVWPFVSARVSGG